MARNQMLVGFNVPFQHKYGYIRDERSGLESYPYPAIYQPQPVKLLISAYFTGELTQRDPQEVTEEGP